MILLQSTFTTQSAARAMHVEPTEVAKSVLIKADQLLLARVPAIAALDLAAICK